MKNLEIWIILGLLLLLILYLYYQNNLLSLTTYNIAVPRMHASMKGKKIVFLSDTHFRDKTPHTYIDRLVIQVEDLNPDIILFGGDIVHVTDSEAVIEHAKDLFAQLANVAPTYIVYGNHDLQNDRMKELSEVIQIAGANLLKNEAQWISFDEPGNGFWLMGLAEYESSLAIRDNVLETIKLAEDHKKEPKILLTHFPQYFDKYVQDELKRPDLILSGHTHGGQVILPIVGGLFSPGQGFNPHYDFGLFTNAKYPNSRLIVTRGVGNSTFPFRINNRPEIVSIFFN